MNKPTSTAELALESTRLANGTETPDKAPRPRFLASLATIFGGQTACAAVAVGIEISYARLLGPEGRGQVGLCMMVIAIGAVIGTLGGEVPIMIWTANQKKSFEEWLPSMGLLGVVGSGMAAGLWWVVFWRWHPLFLRGMTEQLAGVVFLAIPISVFFAYLVALLTGMEWFRMRGGVTLASQVTELLGILALVLVLGRTAQIAVIGNAAGLLAAVVLGAFLVRESFRSVKRLAPSWREIWSALRLGVPGQLGSVAGFFSYRLDVFVVNYFLDPSQVGLYALGVVISESLWQIPQAAAVALLPRTARTIDNTAGRFTCFVSRQVLLLACVLGLLLAITSPVAVPMVFGERFAPSVAVIWWILPGTIALALGKVMSADITARGRPGFNSLVAISGGVMTILLDFVLIPRMGIRGAALASSITYFVEAVLIAIGLKHMLNTSWRTLLVPSITDLAAYRAILRRGES